MDNMRMPGQMNVPGREFNRPRNIWKWGDEHSRSKTQWNRFLRMLTVPIEVFFRYDFGQRWLTTTNVLAGFVILLLFTGLEWLEHLFFLSIAYRWILGFLDGLFDFHPSLPRYIPGMQKMGWILAIYSILSIFHLIRTWQRSRSKKPQHSFYDGTSLFEPAAKIIMRFLNWITKPLITISRLPLSKAARERRRSSAPLFNNITYFTDTFVEPTILLLFAIFFRGTLSLWLILSFVAVVQNVIKKNIIRRNSYLDYRDSVVEAEQMRDYHSTHYGSSQHDPIINRQPIISFQETQPQEEENSRSILPDLEQIIDEHQRQVKNQRNK